MPHSVKENKFVERANAFTACKTHAYPKDKNGFHFYPVMIEIVMAVCVSIFLSSPRL